MATAYQTLNTVTGLIRTAVGADADVSIEFSGTRQTLPVRRNCVSTGVHETSVTYGKDKDGNQTVTRTVTVEAIICSPKTAGASQMTLLFDRILSGLITANGRTVTLCDVSSNKISYSSSLGALILPMYVKVTF